MLIILFLYALCAATFTLCKAALSCAQPFFYVGLRMTCAGIALLVYHVVRNQRITIERRDIFLFIHIILFHVFGAYMLDLWALQYITSIESALLYNLSPFIAALISYFWIGEKLSIKKFLALGLGLFSLVPLLTEHITFSGLPVLVMLAAVSCAAYGWIVVQELVKQCSYSPVFVNGIGMLGGGILALMSSWYCEPWHPYPVTDWYNLMLMICAIIIIGNIIFYNLYGYLLKKYSATLLAFAGFTCPFFAALYGNIFLNEAITLSLLASACCAFVGLYLFYHEELKPS